MLYPALQVLPGSPPTALHVWPSALPRKMSSPCSTSIGRRRGSTWYKHIMNSSIAEAPGLDSGARRKSPDRRPRSSAAEVFGIPEPCTTVRHQAGSAGRRRTSWP